MPCLRLLDKVRGIGWASSKFFVPLSFLSCIERLKPPLDNGLTEDLFRLVWAELYLTVPALVSQFDLELYEITIEDSQFGSDAFVTQTKSHNNARVTVRRLFRNS